MKIFGIILIVVGVLMLIFREIQYTKKEKLVDVGPVEITRKEPKTVIWPYYAGGIAIAAGIILLVLDNKKSKG